MNGSCWILTIGLLGLLVKGNANAEARLWQNFLHYFNTIREQTFFAGLRKVYWDNGLAQEAEKTLAACDKSIFPNSRDKGGFYLVTDSGDPDNSKAILGADFRDNVRANLNMKDGTCRSMDSETCKRVFEAFNPMVYLIGCARKRCGEEVLAYCVTNRRFRPDTRLEKIERNKCPICTESFTCDESNSKKVCQLKDETMTKNLPEDFLETTSAHIESSGRTEGGQSSSSQTILAASSLISCVMLFLAFY